MTRSWRVEAITTIPTHISTSPEGGLPQVLEPASRIPVGEFSISGDTFEVRQLDTHPVSSLAGDIRFRAAEIIFQVHAATIEAAYDKASEFLEGLLDSLSFQLQFVVPVHRMEFLDVTPPVEIGEERAMALHAAEDAGFAQLKFRPASVDMTGTQTTMVPDASLCLDRNDVKAAAGLDWYLKGLGAGLQVDRFIFLWISTEILSKRKVADVTEPYRVPGCGHVILTCPQCGNTTSKPVGGATIRKYLTSFGIDSDLAADLWRARQILHGNEAFDSKLMLRLDELSQVLKAIIVMELKAAFGLEEAVPPLVAPKSMSILPGVGLQGRRAVSQDDLA
jgi:hypothetical protein